MIILVGAAWFIVNMDIFSLSTPSHWRESDDWGTPAYHNRIYFEVAEWLAQALLAMLPNRWLVSLRITFAAALLIALIPLFGIFYNMFSSDMDWSDRLMLMIPVVLFTPLPLSLILSFARLRKGEKVFYA
jgi:hypothetical protein